MSNTDLGRRVGLSPNAAGARVQRLREQGVITGFTAVIDHATLGRPMEASIDIWMQDPSEKQALYDLAQTDDRIIECFHLTGPLDFRMRARVASSDDLNDLLELCRSEAGVRQTDSRLILNSSQRSR